MGVTIRRFLAVLFALSLLAACGSGGDGDDSATDRSTGDKASTTTADDGQTPAGTDAADDGTTSTGPTVTSGEKPTPITAGSGGSGGNTTATTSATSGTAPPRTGDERSATAGTYAYHRTRDGSPTQGTLVVHAPQGSDQRYVTTYPGGEANELVVRARSGAIDLLMLKTTTPLFGTKEFRPSPPVLFAPDPAKVGATWSWRMTSIDGGRTLDGAFRVVRTERVTVGGEPVDTVVVEGTVNISGDITGTLHQTSWASPRYRLVVRADERLESAFAQYTQSALLASTRPA